MEAAIDLDQDALGCGALCAVAGDAMPVLEGAALGGIGTGEFSRESIGSVFPIVPAKQRRELRNASALYTTQLDGGCAGGLACVDRSLRST